MQTTEVVDAASSPNAEAMVFHFDWLVLPLLVFVPLERLFAARPSQRIFRRGWFTDLTYVFLNRPVIQFGVIAVIVAATMAADHVVPARLRSTIGSQPIWLQVVQIFFLADLGFYAAHRMFHAVPALWRFHAIHHSIEELDWLAAARVHPIDQIVTKGISLVPPFIVGYSDGALAIFTFIYFWHSFLLHSNVRLGLGPLNRVLATPVFHHWHHAVDRDARDTNFAAQLSLLDTIFGTYRLPADRTPSRFGTDDAVPGTYLRNLLYPLARRRRAAGALRATPA
jgi:sterol desaturase/sphingolipid hydroxylase (fatty acid hydroxylase superfamily)